MKKEIDFLRLRKVFKEKKAGLEKRGEEVIPVVVQNVLTKEVLILAYANKEALNYSLRHSIAAFWSTSRNELWIKGLTSGSFLELVEVKINCENNSLLYLVKPLNGRGACHNKEDDGSYRKSCFYRAVVLKNGEIFIEDGRRKK